MTSKDEPTDVQLDISKYEGHYEGPWEYSADSQCIFGQQNEETGNWPVLVEFPEFLHGVSTAEEYNNHPEVLKHTKTTPDGKVYHEKSFWWGDALPRMFANLKLMADAPLLLEEVKRLRSEISKWTAYATYVENVNMNCHQDACAEAGFLWKCSDCGAHFELPEDGIYECEFGCDASE